MAGNVHPLPNRELLLGHLNLDEAMTLVEGLEGCTTDTEVRETLRAGVVARVAAIEEELAGADDPEVA